MTVLLPGSHRAAGLTDDAALLRAMVEVEVAWARVLGSPITVTVPELDPEEIEAAGNPVPALVKALRAQVSTPVHIGLTSQDVLDTAFMLVSRDVVARVSEDLTRVASALASLAEEHRSSVMAGRTLTQFAVPITFGLKAARWLTGVLDGLDALSGLSFPVQCGGAAGTLSRAASVVDPLAGAASFASFLGLEWPGLPWHTHRTPVTRLGDALVGVCDALGVIAGDVLVLGRPEIGELSEGAVAGRGGSSTMPHKRNPVLSVLVNSAALRAPGLAAQLHLCASRARDERPDGAWHAEWPAWRSLLELTAVAASQTAELVEGLEVHADVMARRAAGAAGELLAERPSVASGGGPGVPGAPVGRGRDGLGAGPPSEPGGGPDLAGDQPGGAGSAGRAGSSVSADLAGGVGSPVSAGSAGLADPSAPADSSVSVDPPGRADPSAPAGPSAPADSPGRAHPSAPAGPPGQAAPAPAGEAAPSGQTAAPSGQTAAPSGQTATTADLAAYLGATDAFIDAVLLRNRSRLAPLRGEREAPTPIVPRGSDRNGG